MGGDKERELFDEGAMEPLDVAGGMDRDKSLLVKPSKSKTESPVGVMGVEHEPRRMAAFSSSRFLRQAALGFR